MQPPLPLLFLVVVGLQHLTRRPTPGRHQLFSFSLTSQALRILAQPQLLVQRPLVRCPLQFVPFSSSASQVSMARQDLPLWQQPPARPRLQLWTFSSSSPSPAEPESSTPEKSKKK